MCEHEELTSSGNLTTARLSNGFDYPLSTRYLAQQVVARTSSHTCAADLGGCDRAPATYTPLAKGH